MTITPDQINGLFEIVGSAFVLPSIIAIIKQKEVHGINWITQLFFTSWSIWNLYFYPSEELFSSFYGAVFLSLSQLIWLILLIYYSFFYHGKNNAV